MSDTEDDRKKAHLERLALAGELAAKVAHQIKNPLAPIRGYAQMLSQRLDSVALDQRALFERALAIIAEQSDEIQRRVDELLSTAKGAQLSADVLRAIDLRPALERASLVFEAHPAVRQIVVQVAPELRAVTASADGLAIALSNILTNAAEAMAPAGGAIAIEARADGDLARIEIRDEGSGVSIDDPERPFDAFYTTKSGGSGLGLAIARSAIEAMGGSISLRSRDDRRGAVVTLTLERSND